MSTENRLLDLPYVAAEDLSSYQYHFVVMNSSGQVRLPDSANEVAFGILQNAPASGEIAAVRVAGVSKFKGNAAIDIGKFIRPEYVGAADAGKGQDAGANWMSARGYVLEDTDAENDLGSCLLVNAPPIALGWNAQVPVTQGLTSTISTADVVTYTATQLLGGLILRDPNGGARSDVTPTAALIIAAITQAATGNRFEFTIRNTADAAETITITAGTDVTLSGTMTIAQNNSKRFLVEVTGATTVTIYSLGTVVYLYGETAQVDRAVAI